MWEVLITPILVAIISGPLVALINAMRKENRSDHEVVQGGLNKIDSKIDNMESKLDKHIERFDDHIEWHLDKTQEK